MICAASSARPSALAARASAIFPALDCGRREGKIVGDLGRRLGMRRQFGFLPAAYPSAPWPARMGLEERGERREGRMRVRAQRRPFQRQSLRRIVSRLGERREAGGVALIVQHRGLRTARRRRRAASPLQGRARARTGRRRSLRAAPLRREYRRRRIGRRDWRRSQSPERARCRGDRGRGRDARGPNAVRGRRRRVGECRHRRIGRRDWRRSRPRRAAAARSGRWGRRSRRERACRRDYPRSAIALGSGAPELGWRAARMRRECNQASGAAQGQDRARPENHHGSSPLVRGWTDLGDQYGKP